MNNQYAQLGQQGQQAPSVQEMRAQVVAMMQRSGIPVPPKPSVAELKANGADADAVHELMHVKQAENMANTITLLSHKLIAARDALEAEIGEDAEMVADIDQALNIVSVQSLTASKLVLDLQEIEQEMRDEQTEDFDMGGYL